MPGMELRCYDKRLDIVLPYNMVVDKVVTHKLGSAGTIDPLDMREAVSIYMKEAD